MTYRSARKNYFISTLLLLCIQSVIWLPSVAFAEQGYQFAQSWPRKDKPWFFNGADALAVDGAGRLYVWTEDDTIMKLTPEGQLITEWGGHGTTDGKLNQAGGVAVDGIGNVYVAEPHNHRVQKFTPEGAFVAKWTHAGEGEAISFQPEDVAVDAAGNVYVTDSGGNCVHKFDPEGRILNTWGSEGTNDGEFGDPKGIEIDGAGNVYVTDSENCRIQKLASDGRFLTSWSIETSSGLCDLRDIALDAEGNVYVIDTFYDSVYKFTADGKILAQWSETQGETGHLFHYPSGVAMDDKSVLYLAEKYANQILLLSPDGMLLDRWWAAGSGDGEFSVPKGIAVDGNGNVYVADAGNDRIQKFSSDGSLAAIWGSTGSADGKFSNPSVVALDGDENVYVADAGNNRIQKFNSKGDFLTKWDCGGGYTTFSNLAIGTDNNVYLTRLGSGSWGGDWCTQQFSPDGVLLQTLSQGDQFNSWRAVCPGSAGHFYILEYYCIEIGGVFQITCRDHNQRVYKYSPDGIQRELLLDTGNSGVFEDVSIYYIMTDLNGALNVYGWSYTDDSYCVYRFDNSDTYIDRACINPITFNSLENMAIGLSRNLYITDTYYNSVQQFILSNSTIYDRINGIWKILDNTMNMYIQTYSNNTVISILTSDLFDFYVFMDADVKDGSNDGIRIIGKDYQGKESHTSMMMYSDHEGVINVTVDDVTKTHRIYKSFGIPAAPSNHGIWKSPDCSEGVMNYYIQTYDTGSAVVIGTADLEEFYVFLDPKYSDGIAADELGGKPYHLTMSFDKDEVGMERMARCFEAPLAASPASQTAWVELSSTVPPIMTNGLGMTFAYVAPGTYTMGSPTSEAGRQMDETQHQVTLTKGFYFQTSEVTVAQFRQFVQESGYLTKAEQDGWCWTWDGEQWNQEQGADWETPGFPQSDTHPVTCVSWNDATAFAQWLTQKEGSTYRLPFEAEWEYASRAGSPTAFANGDIVETHCQIDANLDAMAWYCGNAQGQTHAVESKTSNACGLYDLHGNVHEWCQDWYGAYPSGPETDPTGPGMGSKRIVRGGSWPDFAWLCRSAFRNKIVPEYRYNNLGIRLVRESE